MFLHRVLFYAPDLFSGDVNNFCAFKCDYVLSKSYFTVMAVIPCQR